MSSNIRPVKDKEVFLIDMKDKCELFIANDCRYASSVLTLEEMKTLRKELTDQIIKISFNGQPRRPQQDK